MDWLLTDRKQLDREAWLLELISGLFAASTALSNTFVNVYLWKINSQFSLIGWFNLVGYVAMAAAFVVAGRLAKRVDRVVIVRLGVALQALFYLSVLMLGREAVRYVTLLGSFMGIGRDFSGWPITCCISRSRSGTTGTSTTASTGCWFRRPESSLRCCPAGSSSRSINLRATGSFSASHWGL